MLVYYLLVFLLFCYLFFFLFACLPSCLLACLLVCFFARSLVCLFTWLSACFFAWLLVCFFSCKTWDLRLLFLETRFVSRNNNVGNREREEWVKTAKTLQMNSTTTWIIRILGLCFVAITIYCCFAPISAAADVIGDLIGCLPCVGDFLEDLLEGMVDTLLWIVSCALGCSCGLLVISLTWLVMRPLIGGGLLLVCLVLGCCAFAIAHQHKANRDAARSFDGDDVELRGKLAANSDESEWALYSLIQFLWFEYSMFLSALRNRLKDVKAAGLWCATTAGARMSSLQNAQRHAGWCLCNPVLCSCYLSPIPWKYQGFGGLHNAISQLGEDPALYLCSNSELIVGWSTLRWLTATSVSTGLS